MPKVRQITLRNPSPEVVERLRQLAKERGESLNATVLGVLEDALGIRRRRRSLERYATWNDNDFEEFEAALKAQRTVDDRLWK